LGSRLRPRPARGPRGRAERRRRRLCRRLRGSRGAQSLSTPPRPCHNSAPRSPFLTAGVLLSTPAPGVSVTQRQELEGGTPHTYQVSSVAMAAERKLTGEGRAFLPSALLIGRLLGSDWLLLKLSDRRSDAYLVARRRKDPFQLCASKPTLSCGHRPGLT
jgi:hypothetical protein